MKIFLAFLAVARSADVNASRWPPEQLYWDGQCSACPAKLYQGPAEGWPEGARLYWDGQCKACPAHLYSHCSAGGSLVGERGCGFANIFCEGHCERPAAAPRPADWIIVGGGASGCSAAAALADAGEEEEDPDYFQKNFDETFNLTDFYASSKWVAEQLSVPLRGSNFAQEGSPDPQPSVRMIKDSSWVASATFNTSKETWIRRGAAALLHERSSLKNLRFFTGYQVKRINFEGSRATSVLAENNFNEWVTIEARKGVILAGGAVFTPQILQVSGIGDPSLLSQLGVAEVVPNADVGRNFVDRAILNFGVWASQHKPLYVGYAMSSNTTSNITIEAEGWGKVASSFAIPSLGMVPPDQRTEALRGLMKPLLTGPLANIMNNMIQIVGLNHHTYSRGSDPRDMEQQFVAMDTLKKVAYSEALQDLVNAKTFHGSNAVLPVYLSCLGKPQTDAKAIIIPKSWISQTPISVLEKEKQVVLISCRLVFA
eukprot:g13315.t1